MVGLDSEDAALRSRLTEYRQGLLPDARPRRPGRRGAVRPRLPRAAGGARQHARRRWRRERERRASARPVLLGARPGRGDRPGRAPARQRRERHLGQRRPRPRRSARAGSSAATRSATTRSTSTSTRSSASLTGGVDVSGVPPMIAYFLASILWLLTSFLANLLITLFSLRLQPRPRQRLAGDRRRRGAGAGLAGDPLDLRQRLRRALARPRDRGRRHLGDVEGAGAAPLLRDGRRARPSR